MATTEAAPGAVLPLLLNTSEAARLLGRRTGQTIRMWIENGTIPPAAIQQGPPRYLLRRLVLERHFGLDAGDRPAARKRRK